MWHSHGKIDPGPGGGRNLPSLDHNGLMRITEKIMPLLVLLYYVRKILLGNLRYL